MQAYGCFLLSGTNLVRLYYRCFLEWMLWLWLHWLLITHSDSHITVMLLHLYVRVVHGVTMTTHIALELMLAWDAAETEKLAQPH